MVVASPVTDVANRETFMETVDDHRAQGWRSSAWEKVSETDRWTLETVIPYRTPLTPSEKNRLIRLMAKAPSKGVWIGLVAYERMMSRDIAIRIVERAIDSVHPMVEDAAVSSAPSAADNP